MEKNEINAEWARKQATSVLNDKVKKEVDTCLNAIERAVATNEMSTCVYIYAHSLTLEDLTKRNFTVKQEDNQMDGAFLRISW